MIDEDEFVAGDGTPLLVVDEVARSKLDKSRSSMWQNVIVRLADEGVPVRPIVRAMLMEYQQVRDVINDAHERGLITVIPRDEWPQGTRRDERLPDTVPLEYEDEHLNMLTIRRFGLTASEARMFTALLRRPEMTKAQLHKNTHGYEGGTHKDPTALKIVDVFIHKIRKKLEKISPDVRIETIWGKGYAMGPMSKAEAFKLLGVQDKNHPTPAGAGSAAAPTTAKAA